MTRPSPTILTMIGLPIFLLAALGLAFSASFVSRTLRADPTLNTNHHTLTTNTASPTVNPNYTAALTTMTATIYQRMVESATLTNEAANQTSAAQSAQVVLAAVCWLSTHSADLQYFPLGTVRQDFMSMISLYGPTAGADAACAGISDEAERQASRLMTLDDDGDGLNTVAEYWYDTNQFAKDTDQDGFTDAEEIANGFNPLGPGPAQTLHP